MADFLPFSQSRLSNQFLKMAASYSYFSLAILDLGRQIEESEVSKNNFEMFFYFYISSRKVWIEKKVSKL